MTIPILGRRPSPAVGTVFPLMTAAGVPQLYRVDRATTQGVLTLVPLTRDEEDQFVRAMNEQVRQRAAWRMCLAIAIVAAYRWAATPLPETIVPTDEHGELDRIANELRAMYPLDLADGPPQGSA